MRGFSLIELIVVVAVISLLSSIAVPQYENYRKRMIVLEAIDLAKQFSKDAIIRYNSSEIFYPGALGSNSLDNLAGPNLCAVAGCGIDPGVDYMRLVYSTTAAEPTFHVAVVFTQAFTGELFRNRLSLITKLTDEGIVETRCGWRSNRDLNANLLPNNCRAEESVFFGS